MNRLPDGSFIITGDEVAANDIWTIKPDHYTGPAGLPYLRVDEQSTYIDVYCDGYVIRFKFDDDVLYPQEIRNADSSVLYADFFASIVDASYDYFFGYDGERTCEIMENTPTRVVIRVVGNYDRTSGTTNNYLSGLDLVTYTWTMYSDRFTVDVKLDISSTITLADDATNRIIGFDDDSLTNTDNIYETGGSEADPGDSEDITGADYVGFVSDEINLTISPLDHDETGTATYFEAAISAGRPLMGWTDGTLTANSIMSAMIIIDSSDRAYGSKLYSSTDRLAMGDQYKDHLIG